MRHHMQLAAVLAIALFAVQANAQTTKCPATRIECNASFAQATITASASAISGKDTTRLTFTERRPVFESYEYEFTSQPVTITPSMRLVGNMSAMLSVQKLPQYDFRGFPSTEQSVPLEVRMGLCDAVSGSGLHVSAPFPLAECLATDPLDTAMGGDWQVDLSPYIGRKVYLWMWVATNFQMIEARQVKIVDAICADAQHSTTNSINMLGVK